MKSFKDQTNDARKYTTQLFTTWLKPYSTAVIQKVMARADEIITNDHAMNLLKELDKRERDEEQDFERTIWFMLDVPEQFKDSNPHCNVLTHSQSYRDVLYDMYIKDC